MVVSNIGESEIVMVDVSRSTSLKPLFASTQQTGKSLSSTATTTKLV